MSRRVIVTIDDWAGLYVSGVLVAEGHSLSNYDLLWAGVIDEVRGLDGTPFEEEMMDGGGMPKCLSKVPKS